MSEVWWGNVTIEITELPPKSSNPSNRGFRKSTERPILIDDPTTPRRWWLNEISFKHYLNIIKMATRQKKTVVSGVTREAMEDAFGKYATADARIASIMADIDKQLVKIREKHADELAELEREKQEAFEVMGVFATEHREECFTKRRSMETIHGTIGFRTGQPKLKPKKGFTWAAVLELLKKLGKDYVRTVDEPAKDKLLADREDEACVKVMEDCGISVVQDETFFVEPKKEKES